MSQLPQPTGFRKNLISYGDAAFSLFLRTAFIKGAGYTDDALSRPIVGIVNTKDLFFLFSTSGVVLPALFAVLSLAVDLGRAQLVKLELQRSADATARGYIAVRINRGDTMAQTVGPKIADMNPVDGNAMALADPHGSWLTWLDS